MQFQELPELVSTPVDKSQILVGDKGVLYQADNLFDQINDAEMVRLVLSKITPNTQLDDHIADQSLHTKIEDNTISAGTTWSSNRINTAISGSNPWFNLDGIPEGITNRYFTEQRARDVIASTTQGIPVIDHRAIASQLVSLLMGFNSSTFRYRRSNISDSTPTVSVSVNGGTPTINFFDVTPGVQNIQITPPNTGETWVCEELAHSIQINANGSRQITPKLTLDSFLDGTINKLWNTQTFANSTLVQSINTHLGANFTNHHARINDAAATGSSDFTWSSNRIISYLSSELARNRVAVAANAKSVWVGHEIAASGQNATGYTWDSIVAGTVHTHHVMRNPASAGYNGATGVFLSSNNIQLPPGTWLVYWDADMTLRTGLFTAVTSPMTYIALATTPRTPLLTNPGVITVTGTNSVNYRLVSRFNTTTAYNASFQNTWLQPQSIAGVGELYATVHIERVR